MGRRHKSAERLRVFYLRLNVPLHTALFAESDALGYTDASEYIRSLLRERLSGRLRLLDSGAPANPAQLELVPHPPAPPQGGERPEGVRDGAESETCEACGVRLDDPYHAAGFCSHFKATIAPGAPLRGGLAVVPRRRKTDRPAPISSKPRTPAAALKVVKAKAAKARSRQGLPAKKANASKPSRVTKKPAKKRGAKRK